MNNEEAQKVLDELQNVRPEMLNGEAKRLFEAIMKIADERDLLKEQQEYVINEYGRTIEKQDKIINEMAKYIDDTQMECNVYYKDKEEVIEYFTKKVGE